MKGRPASPMPATTRDSQAPRSPQLATPEKCESKGEVQTVREAAVAEAIREWIVPLLVRKFLDERTRNPASESAQVDTGRVEL